jgi:hypothetical protein
MAQQQGPHPGPNAPQQQNKGPGGDSEEARGVSPSQGGTQHNLGQGAGSQGDQTQPPKK